MVVILGGKNPLFVDVTSNFAEASGVVVPIPTFWEKAVKHKNIRAIAINNLFIISNFNLINIHNKNKNK